MADKQAEGVKNQVVGAGKVVSGKLRDAAADLTGDTSEQIKGKAQVVEGKLQGAVGQVQEKVGQKEEEKRARDDRNRNRP